MKYQNKRYAVVNKPSASTALYFENAFSLKGGMNGMLNGLADLFTPKEEGIIQDFMVNPGDVFGSDYNKQIISENALEILKANFINLEHNKTLFDLVKDTIELYGTEEYGNREKIINDFVNEYVRTTKNQINAQAFVDNLFISSATARLRYQGLYAVPVFEDISNPDWIGGDNLQEGIELAFIDIPVIDNQSCTWEHAKELREDKVAKSQLRNFRLFLDDIDLSKGKDFIQDTFSLKIEEYENASRKHGFNFIKNTVKAFLNKKSLVKLISGNPSELIFGTENGSPSLIDALGSSNLYSAVSDLGNFSLGIADARITNKLGMNESGIEYLISVKQKIES